MAAIDIFAAILSILSVLLFMVAAYVFYNAIKKFTVGRFKEFNNVMLVTLILVTLLRLFAVALQYFQSKGNILAAEISQVTVLLLAILVAIGFLVAGWKLKAFSEQFGFAKLDVGGASVVKEAEKKFISVMMKAKKR